MTKLFKDKLFKTAFRDEEGKLLFHVQFANGTGGDKNIEAALLEQILKSGDDKNA